MTMMLKCWCVLVLLFTALLLNARGEDYSERDGGEQRQVAAARGMREDFGVDFARTGGIIHRYYTKYSKIKKISNIVRSFSLTVLDDVDMVMLVYDFEKDNALNQWKAVQRHQIDSSGWIASDGDSEEQQPRRRLRKRKRRPEAAPEMHSRPRRRRPVRLDEVRDTWKELEAETPKRTYTRRRISPVYLPQLNTAGVVSATMKFGEEQNENEKKVTTGRRKEALNEGNERRQEVNDGSERMTGMGRRRRLRTSTTSTTSTTTNSPASVVDIKNLIKQNGGMSLSEILQKRNLSLTDLLKGKQQAISALSGNTVQSPQKIEVVMNEKTTITNWNQSEKPLKMENDWRQDDEDTVKPVRVMNNWRNTQNDEQQEHEGTFPKVTNNLEDRPKPVKLKTEIKDEQILTEDRSQTDKSVNIISNWRLNERQVTNNEEKPVMVTLDWLQNEDDRFEQTEEPIRRRPTENPVDFIIQTEDEVFEQAEQPVKMTNGWGKTEKPVEVIDNFKQSDQPMNDWRQSVDILDLMQQTETPKGDTNTKRPQVQPSIEGIVDKAVLEAQRKRIGILYKNNGRKVYSDITKKDVVTETTTTDKRIFVPSHPKYYTSLNYKPDFGMEQMRTTTLETPVTSLPTKKSKLPLTSAKLSHSIKKDTIPPKAIKISLSDILGFKPPHTDNDTKNKEDVGPLKMLFDLEELVKQDFDSNTVIPLETTSLPYTSTKYPEVEYTTEFVQEKMRAVSAKDEIMEILKDEDTKKHLSKILEVRNMTVDELVEQRERGSSQRHLADIFHNKTKEPEPVLKHVGEVKMVRKGKTVQQEIDAKPLPDVSMSSEEFLTSERIPGTSFPTYKIETNKMQSPPLPIPVWKTIYPSVISKEVVSEEIPIIEEIENTISEAVNEELSNDLTKTNYDYDEYVQLPLGVKSAIFASLAIIGISIIVFLTILIIFKWAQRQKQRLCYPGTFKSPILQSDSRRSIRTFVSETLGRKKSLYTSRLQSMSDSWDGDKPYQ